MAESLSVPVQAVDDQPRYLPPSRPRTVVDLVDTSVPANQDGGMPLKPTAVFVNGQPVLVGRDGITVDHSTSGSGRDCATVTLKLLVSSLSVRGYLPADVQHLTEYKPQVS